MPRRYAELVPAKRQMVNALVYPLPHTRPWRSPEQDHSRQRDARPDGLLPRAQGRLRRAPDPVEDFLEPARRLLPDLSLADLRLGGSGIRPKLHPPDVSYADFFIARDAVSPRVVHAAGIESPGLTSCLSIGAHVADLVGEIL